MQFLFYVKIKTVDIGVIIKARSIAEINSELSKHGISLNNIYSTTDTIWQQLRSCLMAAIALDDTDQPVEKDEPDRPDEPEEPDSATKGDQPEYLLKKQTLRYQNQLKNM